MHEILQNNKIYPTRNTRKNTLGNIPNNMGTRKRARKRGSERMKEIEEIEKEVEMAYLRGQEVERLRILKEFNDFENADEIKTSQGKHELWTPSDIAVYNICKKIVENKKEPEKEEKK